MTKHQLTTMLMALALLISITAATLAAETPPNIVVILADDMGYGDLKPFNSKSKISTPHLEKFAKAGMIFTDAHSGGTTCKPSRYSLMTGQFSSRRTQFNDRQGPIISQDQETIASLLRKNGYATSMVGKWHLGFDQKLKEKGPDGFRFDYSQPLTGGPADRGFDSYFGMHASLDIPPYFFIQDRTPTKAPTETVPDSTSVGGAEDWNQIQGAFWRKGTVGPDFKHLEVTPRFTSEAKKVIESHQGDQPLFLYLALPSPHTPWLPTKEFVGKSEAGMYGDFTMLVDSVVGQVLSSLDKAGMSDNTLVLFSSDNGPVWYDKDTERFGHRSNGTLRGIKGSVWEGGHRVPFIAKWPGHIAAGTKNERTIAFADLLATFADLVGQEDTVETPDSVSFLPDLLHPDQRQDQRPPILHGDKVIRDGDWKLIATKGGRGFGANSKQKYGTELYNLRKDLSEVNNLAEIMPEKVESLKAKIEQILNE